MPQIYKKGYFKCAINVYQKMYNFNSDPVNLQLPNARNFRSITAGKVCQCAIPRLDPVLFISKWFGTCKIQIYLSLNLFY
jgi:hypothetical protein